VASKHANNVASAYLPYTNKSICARGDERLALGGEAHVVHSAAVAAFAVANFLDDVVGGGAVEQDDAVGGAAAEGG
jgi:hypothetical protein